MTPHFVSKAAQVTGGMVCMCISDLFICLLFVRTGKRRGDRNEKQ